MLLARLLAAALLLLAGSAYLQRPGPSLSGLLRYAAAATVAAARGRETIPWGALDSRPILTALGAHGAGWANEPESRPLTTASAAAALAVVIKAPGFLPWAVPGSALLQQLGTAVSELLRLHAGSAAAAPGPLTAQQPGAQGVSQLSMPPLRALLQLPLGGAAAPAAAALSRRAALRLRDAHSRRRAGADPAGPAPYFSARGASAGAVAAAAAAAAAHGACACARACASQ